MLRVKVLNLIIYESKESYTEKYREQSPLRWLKTVSLFF